MSNLKDEIKEKYYDKRTLANKICANSFLPMLMSNMFMYYDNELIESISEEGQRITEEFITYTNDLKQYLEDE